MYSAGQRKNKQKKNIKRRTQEYTVTIIYYVAQEQEHGQSIYRTHKKQWGPSIL